MITCVDGPVAYQEFFKYPDGIAFQNTREVDKAYKTNTFVIQSQAELEHYVNLSQHPATVNFKEKTLLAGRTWSANQAYIVKQEVISSCGSNKIEFRISLKYDLFFPNTGKNNYFAVIPKISDKTKVLFSIDYVN